jgi:hypothetical protein
MKIRNLLSLLLVLIIIGFAVYYYANQSYAKGHVVIMSTNNDTLRHLDSVDYTMNVQGRGPMLYASSPPDSMKSLMKIIFSSLFTLSALYVILSRKFDEETKKWAFSVLTLIAGVWIGSVT